MTFGPILTVTEEDRHWWFASRTRALLGLLDAALGERPSTTAGQARPELRLVLDVGCGAGNMTHHLGRYGWVAGIDSFARPLSVSRERGYNVSQAPAEAIPFGRERFDLVALLDVVEHCDDDLGVLIEARRVLKSGGIAAITVPAFPFLWSENDAINGHRRRYTPDALRALLDASGFRVLRLTCNNAAIWPMAAALNALRRAGRRGLDIAAPSTDDDAYQVEMQPAHPFVNAILAAVGRVESALIHKVSLPVGTGLIAIATPRAPSGTAQV